MPAAVERMRQRPRGRQRAPGRCGDRAWNNFSWPALHLWSPPVSAPEPDIANHPGLVMAGDVAGEFEIGGLREPPDEFLRLTRPDQHAVRVVVLHRMTAHLGVIPLRHFGLDSGRPQHAPPNGN